MSDSSFIPDDYRLNIFNFKGRPFVHPIVAFQYKLKEEIPDYVYYRFVGWLQRFLRLSGKGYALHHSENGKKKILCTFNSGLTFSELPVDRYRFSRISPPSLETKYSISTETTYGKGKLEALISQVVAGVLEAKDFFVIGLGEAYHFVYRFDPLSKVFETYSGFVFRPIVHPSGNASILIDPRCKLIPRLSVKDVLFRNVTKSEIEQWLNGKLVWDACPVAPEICVARRKPSENCPLNLQAVGKSCYFKGFERYNVGSPKFAPFLRQYEKCEMIRDAVKLTDPIVKIRFRGTPKLYAYPPSRIRISKEYAEQIAKKQFSSDLTFLMRKILRPYPRKRFVQTSSYAKLLRDLRFRDAEKEIVLDLMFDPAMPLEKDRYWDAAVKFEEPLLRFRDGVNKSVLQGILKYGPLESETERRIQPAILLIGGNERAACEFYEDLAHGYGGYRGLDRLFNLLFPAFDSIPIIDTIEDIKQTKNCGIVLIFDYINRFRREPEYYFSVKSKIASMGLPSQVIEKSVLKVFKRKFVDRYSNSLLNIALGIYGKLGYSAWELSKPIESTDYFIGIDIKPIYENNWVISVHTFNNRGNWLNCRLGRSEPGYLDKLSKMLNDVTRNFEKDVENLVIHREGTPPTKDEFAVYLEALKNYKIEVLWTHKESYVRAYNIRNPKFAVEKGICTKIDDNRFIIFTFITPHGTSSPLMFRKITSHKRKRDFLEQAYEIFILTSVNTGRIFPMTLRPVTTHYANKTSRLFASGVKPLEKGLWFL